MSPLVHGALNKTYPTSATSNLRMETYNDALSTINRSTWNITTSTWTMIGSSYTWIIPSTITVYTWTLISSSFSWTMKHHEWSLDDLLQKVADQTKLNFINKVLDEDMEQYLVWPDTTTFPVKGTWKGWCLSYVNKRPVPIVCP